MDAYLGLPRLIDHSPQMVDLFLELDVLVDLLVVLPVHLIIILLHISISTQKTYKSVDLEDSLSTSNSIG